MQCLYKFSLEPVAEILADNDSYGFRPMRSCHDAIERCFDIYKREDSAQWVLEGDIEKCFDKISHEWLLENVHMDKSILNAWLRAGFVWEGDLFPTDEGTPQGGIISPILANLALDGIEAELAFVFGKKGGVGDKRRRLLKINFVRYADDFVISCSDKDVLENEVKPFLRNFLAKRGLKLSEEKTKITHIDDGFDFLGFNIRKFKGKLIIKPAKKSVIRFLREVKEIFVSNKNAKLENVIRLLNWKIRGWCNYYSHAISSRTFSKVGHRIWQMCWKWSIYRHPNKGKHWVMKKYFFNRGERSWIFGTSEHSLILLNRIPIKRHVKIQRDAEVFNPIWDNYFENR